ncbi:MAG: FAD:protein FMN transferase, partial [Pseudomonadales bacterium]|nr:FAD:protein FMN transferase [Pseudomonadales bacterium]
RTLPVVDLALATSGDYRNFFEHQGAIYSHTIDPRTGWPVSHSLGSVTVLHESAAMADALATAFSVLGPDETMRLAEEENLMVFAIIRQRDGYDERLSGALVRYLDSR